jgi:hypothetical protein
LYKIEKNEGVNYITDEQGKKTAVIISLKNYKEEIEGFFRWPGSSKQGRGSLQLISGSPH